MESIFHLISVEEWESVRAGENWRPSSLADEGFIHCSKNEEQLFGVVQRLFPGRTDLLALEVDTRRLSSPLVNEPSRSGEIYPHIYGPLDIGAVVKVWRVEADGRGSYCLSGP